jgi:hypothetical protein
VVHLVRNNSPYTVIILFIFTLLIKLQALASPQLPVLPQNHIFFDGILDVFNAIFGGSAFAYTMLSVVMLFGQALFLNAIAVRFRLFTKATYVVAYLYLLLTSIHPAFSYFSETLVLNWFLIGALHALLAFHQTVNPRKQIYNAGFLLCLTAVLHFPAIFFIGLLIAALVLLRSFNAGEWIVGLMGYLTPIYFFAGVLFLTDQLPAILQWPDLGLAFSRNMGSPFYTTVVIAGILILFFCGVFVLNGQISRSAVFIRRSWVMIVAGLILALAAAFTTDVTQKSGWLMAMPLLSLIIAQPLNLEKSKRFSNFTFYFSLLFIIICQLAYNY